MEDGGAADGGSVDKDFCTKKGGHSGYGIVLRVRVPLWVEIWTYIGKDVGEDVTGEVVVMEEFWAAGGGSEK